MDLGCGHGVSCWGDSVLTLLCHFPLVGCHQTDPRYRHATDASDASFPGGSLLSRTGLYSEMRVMSKGECISRVCCIFKTPAPAWWEADFVFIVFGKVWKLFYSPPFSLFGDLHPEGGENTFKSHSAEPCIQGSF